MNRNQASRLLPQDHKPVGVDGSPAAEVGHPTGLGDNGDLNRPLTIVHTLEPPTIRGIPQPPVSPLIGASSAIGHHDGKQCGKQWNVSGTRNVKRPRSIATSVQRMHGQRKGHRRCPTTSRSPATSNEALAHPIAATHPLVLLTLRGGQVPQGLLHLMTPRGAHRRLINRRIKGPSHRGRMQTKRSSEVHFRHLLTTSWHRLPATQKGGEP
jgi:hypothetical protein